MGNGSQYLSRSISRTGPSVWINAGGKHRPAWPALRSGRDAAARERDGTVCCGERYLSGRGPFVDRLQPPNPVHRRHVYGVAGGGCGSIRELSIKSRGLEDKGRQLASRRAAGNRAAGMRADIRLCTTIAIIAICGLSIAQGWRIARFSHAMVNIESSEKRTDIINTWTAIPGLASRALQADLTGQIDPSDLQAANRRRETLSSILSIKPLSSVDWLLLSGMQLVTDQPMEQVLESLELSVVTGPNEGYVMAERGIFGV